MLWITDANPHALKIKKITLKVIPENISDVPEITGEVRFSLQNVKSKTSQSKDGIFWNMQKVLTVD